jgi:hypothetical protein
LFSQLLTTSRPDHTKAPKAQILSHCRQDRGIGSLPFHPGYLWE